MTAHAFVGVAVCSKGDRYAWRSMSIGFGRGVAVFLERV